jgi:hypothetical protein
MAMINLYRKFSSHVIEYPGNIFAPNWVHVPVWNIFGAEKGYAHVLESFKEVEHRFPEGTFHLGVILFSKLTKTLCT